MMIGSIDILGGKAVQLQQGDPSRKIHERSDVEALLDDFSLTGTVAVVDLDAALGRGSNADLARRLCSRAEVHVGGGIRDEETARAYLRAGARRLIIGTKAEPEFLSKFHPDHLLAALDFKGSEVVDRGWTKGTGESLMDRARRMEPHVAGFLVTQVDREGLMGGFNMDPLRELRQFTDKILIAAGGVSTVEEIRALSKINIDVQLGMAVYDGRLELKASFVELGDWSKGLLPAIAQDGQGRILMVGFASREALDVTLKTRKATFFSRSKNRLWTKGETSGHVMTVRQVRWDCDRDTLLYLCEASGPACHFGTDTCFGPKTEGLLEALTGDIHTAAGREGWTKKLLETPSLLREKIVEESAEVCDFTDKGNLAWEVADLLYHVAVLMEREGVTFDHVRHHLASRRKP